MHVYMFVCVCVCMCVYGKSLFYTYLRRVFFAYETRWRDLARVMAPPCARSAAAARFSCKSRLRNIQSTTTHVSQTCKGLSHALALIRTMDRRTDRSSTAREDEWSFLDRLPREERRMRRASWTVRGEYFSVFLCCLPRLWMRSLPRGNYKLRKMQKHTFPRPRVPGSSIFSDLNVYCVTLKCGDSKGREAQRIHINAFDDASLSVHQECAALLRGILRGKALGREYAIRHTRNANAYQRALSLVDSGPTISKHLRKKYQHRPIVDILSCIRRERFGANAD